MLSDFLSQTHQLHPRPSKQLSCPHLHEQLTSFPDTRWHAAQLFTRYFTRIGTTPASPATEEAGNKESAKIKLNFDDSETAFVWDVAVSCIALSVKVCLCHYVNS